MSYSNKLYSKLRNCFWVFPFTVLALCWAYKKPTVNSKTMEVGRIRGHRINILVFYTIICPPSLHLFLDYVLHMKYKIEAQWAWGWVIQPISSHREAMSVQHTPASCLPHFPKLQIHPLMPKFLEREHYISCPLKWVKLRRAKNLASCNIYIIGRISSTGNITGIEGLLQMSSKCGPQASITTLSGSWFRTQHLQMSLGPAELKKKML